MSNRLMSKIPKSWGQDTRARRREERAGPIHSPVVTRKMTPEDWARLAEYEKQGKYTPHNPYERGGFKTGRGTRSVY